MIRVEDYGFKVGNDGLSNAKALQLAVSCGGLVCVTTPGVYDVSEQIIIGSNTTLFFGPGVVIRRVASTTGKNGFAIINGGAFTREYNENIKIIGLNLVCNGIESTGFGKTAIIVGLRAQLVFMYVKNLEIRDLECKDLLKKDYCIQISMFENATVENVRIEGLKDGVHFGPGKDFAVRHGRFRTYDDPIALNAFDYSVSNPNVGWIENGIIEDCYDLADDSTVGFFCRILGGCWLDWYEGMEVMHSDTVVSNGRVYRVVMNPEDGKFYKSVTAPCHESGIAEYDGILWVMAQEGAVYDCGCRNLHFKDIYLQKKRGMSAFGIDFNRDTYARSYYPGSKAGVQGDFVLENIHFQSDIPVMLRSNAPVDNIKIVNSDMYGAVLYFQDICAEGLDYPTSNVLVSGTTFKDNGGRIVMCDGNQSVNLKITGSLVASNYKATYTGNVNLVECDIDLTQE